MHINHFPIDHHYKFRENNNRSHSPQLYEAPISISKVLYVPNPMQVFLTPLILQVRGNCEYSGGPIRKVLNVAYE